MSKHYIITISVIVVLSITSISQGIQYHYDSLHRLIQITYDDGSRIVYTYDASGNRSQRIITVQADFEPDLDVDLFDYARFTSQWLNLNCVYPDNCGGADFNWNGSVDLLDLAKFCNFWMYGNIQ